MISMIRFEASNISSFSLSGITSIPRASTTAVEVSGKLHPLSITQSVWVHLPPTIFEWAVEEITASSCLAMLTLRMLPFIVRFFLSSSFRFDSWSFRFLYADEGCMKFSLAVLKYSVLLSCFTGESSSEISSSSLSLLEPLSVTATLLPALFFFFLLLGATLSALPACGAVWFCSLFFLNLQKLLWCPRCPQWGQTPQHCDSS